MLLDVVLGPQKLICGNIFGHMGEPNVISGMAADGHILASRLANVIPRGSGRPVIILVQVRQCMSRFGFQLACKLFHIVQKLLVGHPESLGRTPQALVGFTQRVSTAVVKTHGKGTDSYLTTMEWCLLQGIIQTVKPEWSRTDCKIRGDKERSRSTVAPQNWQCMGEVVSIAVVKSEHDTVRSHRLAPLKHVDCVHQGYEVISFRENVEVFLKLGRRQLRAQGLPKCRIVTVHDTVCRQNNDLVATKQLKEPDHPRPSEEPKDYLSKSIAHARRPPIPIGSRILEQTLPGRTFFQ